MMKANWGLRGLVEFRVVGSSPDPPFKLSQLSALLRRLRFTDDEGHAIHLFEEAKHPLQLRSLMHGELLSHMIQPDLSFLWERVSEAGGSRSSERGWPPGNVSVPGETA